mmetsp:Transcript_36231/g.84997  ORF Transcript_36231/g.84997 Transcript_36231/m.84997 type:complete len:946 (+) Transcript_36231:48-2885(+)
MRDESSGCVLARDVLVLEAQTHKLEELRSQSLNNIQCRRETIDQWRNASVDRLSKNLARKEQDKEQFAHQNKIISDQAGVFKQQACAQLASLGFTPVGTAGEVMQRIRNCRASYAEQVEKHAAEWHHRIEEQLTKEVQAAHQDIVDCQSHRQQLLEAAVRQEKLMQELQHVRRQAREERNQLYQLDSDVTERRKVWQEENYADAISGAPRQLNTSVSSTAKQVVEQPVSRAAAPAAKPQPQTAPHVVKPAVAAIAESGATPAQASPPPRRLDLSVAAAAPVASQAERVPMYGTRSYEVYERLRAYELEMEADLRLLDAPVRPPVLGDASLLGGSRMAPWPARAFEPGPGPPVVHVPSAAVVAPSAALQEPLGGLCLEGLDVRRLGSDHGRLSSSGGRHDALLQSRAGHHSCQQAAAAAEMAPLQHGLGYGVLDRPIVMQDGAGASGMSLPAASHSACPAAPRTSPQALLSPHATEGSCSAVPLNSPLGGTGLLAAAGQATAQAPPAEELNLDAMIPLSARDRLLAMDTATATATLLSTGSCCAQPCQSADAREKELITTPLGDRRGLGDSLLDEAGRGGLDVSESKTLTLSLSAEEGTGLLPPPSVEPEGRTSPLSTQPFQYSPSGGAAVHSLGLHSGDGGAGQRQSPTAAASLSPAAAPPAPKEQAEAGLALDGDDEDARLELMMSMHRPAGIADRMAAAKKASSLAAKTADAPKPWSAGSVAPAAPHLSELEAPRSDDSDDAEGALGKMLGRPAAAAAGDRSSHSQAALFQPVPPSEAMSHGARPAAPPVSDSAKLCASLGADSDSDDPLRAPIGPSSSKDSKTNAGPRRPRNPLGGGMPGMGLFESPARSEAPTTSTPKPAAKSKAPGMQRSWSSADVADVLPGASAKASAGGGGSSALSSMKLGGLGSRGGLASSLKGGSGKMSSSIGGAIDWSLAGDPTW